MKGTALQRLNALLRRARGSGDGGFTLIEVMVAMLIFAVISVAVISALVLMRPQSGVAQARQTATQLAQSRLDKDRAEVPYDQLASQGAIPPIKVGGATYTLTRTLSDTASAPSTVPCGPSATSRGTTDTVTVGWGGAHPGSVTQSTRIVPGARLSTNGGGIAVQVVDHTGAYGDELSAVSVNVSGVTAGQTPQKVTLPSGQTVGCAYFDGLSAGSHTVSLSGAGFISPDEIANPSRAVTVSTGEIATASFQYAKAMTYTVNFKATPTFGGATPSDTVLLPAQLAVSFVTSNGIYTTPVQNTSPAPTVALYPYPEGYSVLAGALGTPGTFDSSSRCLSTDPSQWQQTPGGLLGLSTGPYGSAMFYGRTPTRQPATPGGSAAVNASMGTIPVTLSLNGLLNLSGSYEMDTVQQTGAAGTGATDPGCGAPQGPLVYKVPGGILNTLNSTLTGILQGLGCILNPASCGTPSTAQPTTLMVPFGTWSITMANGTPSLLSVNLNLGTLVNQPSASLNLSLLGLSNAVVIDPRCPATKPLTADGTC